MPRSSTPKTESHPSDEAAVDRDLNPRKAAILDAVVAEYIGTAQPVGSQLVAQVAGVNVSSATVRTEMVALEREGYLVQPHTSAGRIPTDKGYRFFVDHLAEPGILGPAQRQKVSRFFDHVHGEMEDMLERTSGLLVRADALRRGRRRSRPRRRRRSGRSSSSGSVPATSCSSSCLADGAVEKRSIDLDEDVDDDVARRGPARCSRGGLRADRSRRWRRRPEWATPAVDRRRRASRSTALVDARPRRRARPGLRRRVVAARRRVRRGRDRARRPGDPRAAARRRHAPPATCSTAACRSRSAQEHGYEPLARCAVVVAPVSVDGGVRRRRRHPRADADELPASASPPPTVGRRRARLRTASSAARHGEHGEEPHG